MKYINPSLKGLIVGIAMVLATLGIYAAKGDFENNLQYIVYALYVGGILWALTDYKKHHADVQSFKSYFAEGFKFFVVITLVMVVFTIIFLKMNPSFKEQMAASYRTELQKSGNKTPAEIEHAIELSKGYFVTMLTSIAVFSYLAIGALFTLIITAVIRRKSVPQNYNR